jgi:hypothetical protein
MVGCRSFVAAEMARLEWCADMTVPPSRQERADVLGPKKGPRELARSLLGTSPPKSLCSSLWSNTEVVASRAGRRNAAPLR